MSGFQGIYNQSGSPHLYMDAYFDPVMGSTQDGKDDGTRGLMTSWEVDSTGTTWTFKTKDGITFHNGDKATAADAAFWIKTVKESGDVHLSSQGPFKREVADAVAPDANTVVVTMQAKNYFWPFTYVSMAGCGGSPCHLISSKYYQSAGLAEYNKKPVGSGPFKVTSIQPGASITMEALDNHWFWGVPRFKTLIYQQIPEEGTLFAALRGNQIQLGTISRANADSVKNESKLKIVSRPGGTINYRYEQEWVTEYPGYGKNPFSDVRVRQAMHLYAIDREVLANQFMKGFAVPTVNWPANQGDPSYKKLPVMKQDLAKAKSLMAEAGFPNGFEMLMYLWTPPSQPELPEIFEAMAGMWEELGIKVTRRTLSQQAWQATISAPRKYDMPTVSGMFALGLYRFGANQGSTAFNPKSNWQMSDDKALLAEVTRWQGAKSLQDYITVGQEVMPKLVNEVAATPAVLDFTALWGAQADTSIVPDTFQVTRDNISVGLFRVAVPYKAGF